MPSATTKTTDLAKLKEVARIRADEMCEEILKKPVNQMSNYTAQQAFIFEQMLRQNEYIISLLEIIAGK